MRILITGAHGFVGKHVVNLLRDDYKLFTPTKSELDVLDYNAVLGFISINEITHIIHLASKVGGIGANKRYPADFFYDNFMMGINVLKAASMSPMVSKTINIATICSYPRVTDIPFREEKLWDGFPEDTNAPYGIAKRGVIMYGKSLNKQYGTQIVNLMPVNMGGSHDHFNPIYSHVIPAIILKIDKAIQNHQNTIDLWGTGLATREFLHADDCSRAIEVALCKHSKPDPINIGSGKEISIKDLAKKIAVAMEWSGVFNFTGTVSDGQPRRCLDVSKAKSLLGFEAKKTLDNIIEDEVEYFFALKKRNPEKIEYYQSMIY